MTQSERLTINQAREHAARIAAGAELLEARGLAGKALLDEMVIYLPDLQRIWVGTTDGVLATLCEEYPAFYRYATAMEEAAEAECQRAAAGNSALANLPPLPEPVRGLFSQVFTDSAIFEQGIAAWMAAHDAGQTPAPGQEASLLNAYKHWQASVEQLTAHIRPAPLDRQTIVLMMDAIKRLQIRMAALTGDLRRTMPLP